MAPGDTVAIEVRLSTDRADVGGTGNTMAWSGPFSIASCRVNPGIERPATVFSYTPPGCESAAACTSLRAIVLALAVAPPIPDRSILYACDAVIHATAEPGDYLLDCFEPDAGTIAGVALDSECVDGRLTIAALPTATSPPPSSTATPTLTPLRCAGDCDADGDVSIDDLVAAVRIALGAADAATCRAANIDGNAMVSIGELVLAVRAALTGCS